MTPSDPRPLTVAIQGEAGAFSHSAALNLFGQSMELVATRSFPELIRAVRSGKVQRGVIPVENTLAGSVQGNLDLILGNRLHVVAETRVRIKLCLVVPPGTSPEAIRKAASHPVALQQCQTFFAAHPELEPVAVYDTAGSIRDLMSGLAPYDAAIGSALAARIYGGEILEEEIEDDQENHTRFFAISTEPHSRETENPGPSKASLAFVVSHEPGSLHRALGVFAQRGVDLTKLESRPIHGRPWEYRFFADIRNVTPEMLEACLKELAELTLELRVMGTYPESEG